MTMEKKKIYFSERECVLPGFKKIKIRTADGVKPGMIEDPKSSKRPEKQTSRRKK
jgi:hypothetical protein